MSERPSDPIALEVRRALERGDEHASVTLALEGYGPEVLGFLVGLLRDADAAGDVFSMFCEDVWHGVHGVRRQNSLRTWMYSVAHHAAARYRRAGYERRRRPLSAAPFDELVARVRTQTLNCLRTGSRAAIDDLRDQLAPDERMLLILRLDRNLTWNEIASVMATEDAQKGAEELRRDAAVLRKRFERVKERLRKLAEDAGLLPKRGSSSSHT